MNFPINLGPQTWKLIQTTKLIIYQDKYQQNVWHIATYAEKQKSILISTKIYIR